MATLREWVTRLWGTLASEPAGCRPRGGTAAASGTGHRGRAAARQLQRRTRRRAAAIRSGGMAQAMEAVRDQRGLPWLDDLARDLRYGLRALRRNPMFASVAVLTLALGIGANTAIFSLADAVLLRTLPVSNPRDLVVLRQRGPAGDIFPFTSAAAVDLAGSHDVLSGLAAFRPALNTHVSVNGETELALTQSVSGNYHAVLGVHAVVGRTLTEQDREPVAVISHRYWQRRFAGDPNVVGRVLEMQGRSFTIVGVTPPEFFGTQPGRHVDVTAPLGAQTMTMPPNARWLYLVGRLAPGVSREQARAALRVRWAQLAAAQSSPSRPRRDARARFRRAGIERAPPAVLAAPSDSDGGGGRGAARRLRQSRGPVDRSLERETAGDSGPAVARSRARADRAPAPDGECAPRRRRRRRRSGARVLGDRSAPRHDVPRSRPNRARCCAERTHARFCGCGHDRHGRVVRASSGARRQPDRRAAHD